MQTPELLNILPHFVLQSLTLLEIQRESGISRRKQASLLALLTHQDKRPDFNDDRARASGKVSISPMTTIFRSLCQKASAGF